MRALYPHRFVWRTLAEEALAYLRFPDPARGHWLVSCAMRTPSGTFPGREAIGFELKRQILDEREPVTALQRHALGEAAVIALYAIDTAIADEAAFQRARP